MSPSRSYLSADDERPIPSLSPSNDFSQPQQASQSVPTPPVQQVSPSIAPPVILNGALPPGFVVSSFTPNLSTAPMLPLDTGMQTNPMTPAGIPLQSSIYSGAPSAVSTSFPSSTEKVVIPSIYSGAQTPASRSKDLYNRPRVNHASDSDSSSRSSSDALATPPGRRGQTPKQPAYEVAPTPEHIVYPVPPRPQSTVSSGSRGTRAARVPLPPSTIGTSSPASTAANIYSRPIYSRSSSGPDIARSPSARTAPLSPLTGAGIPEPLPIPMPGGMPEPPTMIPPPNIMPVIPQVERRQS